ncbi:MAG: DUF2892 domain-containing protein [Candidatus Competibacteraceae bacterium]|nr:DUF2892 domain-containing protein [Candidatus Competibacteraceae bacterium]
MAWIAGIIGVVLLATGFTGSCPAYAATGVSTKRQDGAV